MWVLLTFLLPLCFIIGSSSANSSPEFTRKDYGNYCKWEWQLCGIIYFMITHYHSRFTLMICLCVFIYVFFLFSCLLPLQAPAPPEGGAKAEVFNNFIPSLLHYFCTIWLRIVLVFFLLNQDAFVHCVLWFLFQRVRSEPDYKVPPPPPADVRPLETHWSICWWLCNLS